MKKTGILGGTFNPIHLGHIKLAQCAKDSLSLDNVLFIPSGISYLKLNENVLSKDIRSQMVRLAIKDVPYFEFSDIEINKEGYSYTYETLETLKLKNKDTEFYFIIGADSLYGMDSWMCPEKIFDKCIITVMQRDDVNKDDLEKQREYLSIKYNAQIIILNVGKIDISSTNIRKLLHDKKMDEVKQMLPKDVFEYIYDKGLYI